MLFNKLGITDPRQLDRAETAGLDQAYVQSFHRITGTHRFTEQDVCNLHRLFLGDVFVWAGQYRNVDLTSEDIHWCRAIYVAQEMRRYDRLLAELTPFSPALANGELALRLAKVHGELILIHPFRDGNGRVARLLCDLLLVQAGREPTHRRILTHDKYRPAYLQAIRTLHFQDDVRPLAAFFAGLW